jgi:hypothetical protein
VVISWVGEVLITRGGLAERRVFHRVPKGTPSLCLPSRHRESHDLVRIGSHQPGKGNTNRRKDLHARPTGAVGRSHCRFRESIEKTKRLLGDSEDMLGGHGGRSEVANCFSTSDETRMSSHRRVAISTGIQ